MVSEVSKCGLGFRIEGLGFRVLISHAINLQNPKPQTRLFGIVQSLTSKGPKIGGTHNLGLPKALLMLPRLSCGLNKGVGFRGFRVLGVWGLCGAS